MDRQYSQLYKKGIQYLGVTTPSYVDTTILGPPGSAVTGGTPIPIPFLYNNGTLDINIQNNVSANLINASGVGPQNYSFPANKEMGGLGQVFSLGPDMTKWLTNWLGAAPTNYSNASFTVVQPATVVKFQMPLLDASDNIIQGSTAGAQGPNTLIGYQTTFAVTPVAPTSNFVYGSSTSKFYTYWAFRTPLVIKVTYTGGIAYVTLNSTFGYSGG